MKNFTRAELYERVWATPMSKLAVEFGLSDQGLAKICRKHDIPTPPRGHWAKLASGKPSPQLALPEKNQTGDLRIAIRPNKEKGRRSERGEAVHQSIRKAEAKAAETHPIPESMRSLHPLVAGWISDHKADQEERRKARRGRSARDFYWGGLDPLPDLTERDRYRLRVTSAFLKAVEKRGVRVVGGQRKGKLELEILGEKLPCAIMEKMHRSYGDRDETWSAWVHDHNAGLKPSGWLRFSVEPWGVGTTPKDLIESDKAPADVLLARFIERVMALGPKLVEARKEREERERQWAEEEAIRAERARLAREDDERWDRFRRAAVDWEECQRLKAFLDFLRTKEKSEPEALYDGRSLTDWIAWAEQKIDLLEPTGNLERVFAKPVYGWQG